MCVFPLWMIRVIGRVPWIQAGMASGAREAEKHIGSDIKLPDSNNAGTVWLGTYIEKTGACITAGAVRVVNNSPFLKNLCFDPK